jgi:hypothetical protein
MKELGRAHPRDPSVIRTRGLVGLLSGELDSGRAMLARAWRTEESAAGRACCAFSLGLAYTALDQSLRGARDLRRCRRIDPHCFLLPQFEALLERVLSRAESSRGAIGSTLVRPHPLRD